MIIVIRIPFTTYNPYHHIVDGSKLYVNSLALEGGPEVFKSLTSKSTNEDHPLSIPNNFKARGSQKTRERKDDGIVRDRCDTDKQSPSAA